MPFCLGVTKASILAFSLELWRAYEVSRGVFLELNVMKLGTKSTLSSCENDEGDELLGGIYGSSDQSLWGCLFHLIVA